MPQFRVKTLHKDKVHDKQVTAKNIVEARSLATRNGGQVLAVRAEAKWDWRSKMTLSERQIFFQRVATMITAKVGVSEGLAIIRDSFTGRIKEAAGILHDAIVDGATLPDAMELAGPRYFPDTLVAIVKTGSQGGDLAFALREASRFERELAKVRKESAKGLWGALGGFFIGLIIILASSLWVAPMILESGMVKSNGGTSEDVAWILVFADGLTWFAGFAMAVSVFFFMLSTVLKPLAPAAVDRMILKIPFYRDMVLAKSNYLVFFGLAVLLKAGLRVEEAIGLTIESAPRGELRNDLERALAALIKGTVEPWPTYMNMLHPTDKAALSTAQNREQTGDTIAQLAIQYQEIYTQRLELFVPTMQMFAALFLSAAGFILFGVVIVPMLQSSAALIGSV